MRPRAALSRPHAGRARKPRVPHRLGRAAIAYFGLPARGWYAYSLGAWRIVVLNSNCSQVGGCGAGSPQWRWLRSELAAHPRRCTLAYCITPAGAPGSTAPTARCRELWRTARVGPRRRRARRPRPSLRALRPDRRHPLVRRRHRWQEPLPRLTAAAVEPGVRLDDVRGAPARTPRRRVRLAFPARGRPHLRRLRQRPLSLTAMIRRPADWALACNREMARAATKYKIPPAAQRARLAAAPAPARLGLPGAEHRGLGGMGPPVRRRGSRRLAGRRAAVGHLGPARVRAPALLRADPGRRRRRARLRHRGRSRRGSHGMAAAPWQSTWRARSSRPSVGSSRSSISRSR